MKQLGPYLLGMVLASGTSIPRAAAESVGPPRHAAPAGHSSAEEPDASRSTDGTETSEGAEENDETKRANEPDEAKGADEADGASAPSPTTALGWGHHGLRQFGRGEYRLALQSFRRAERLQHSPVFVLYMARSQRHLGNLERARELYRRVLEDPAGQEGPSAWQKALGDARAELETLEEELGEKSPATAASGDERKEQLHGQEQRPGNATQGPETKTVPDSQRAAPRPARAPKQEPTSSVEVLPSAWEESATPGTRRWGAYTAFGAGGLGLVLTTVTGTMALSRANHVKSRCIGSVCRPEDEPLVHEARRLGNLATVGAAVALTGAATGLTLLFLTDPDDTAVSTRSSPPRPSAWLQVGLGNVRVEGCF